MAVRYPKRVLFAPEVASQLSTAGGVGLERSRVQPQRRAVELVLGIDLGTSCSKVVIGDPGWKGASFAVPYGEEREAIAGWLHPTQFASEKNLKMRLMDNPGNLRLQNLLACCLAEIIRRARQWFLAHAPADYSRCELSWKVNVGYPGKAVDGSPLAGAYGEIVRIAGALAFSRGVLSVEAAEKVRQRKRAKKAGELCSMEVYPEIAAQLAGYVHSPFRKDGNLLLVDVGAGTLDVSTIILHENGGEQVVSFHVCDVKNLGALRLYEQRLHSLNLSKGQRAARAVSRYQNGFSETPEALEGIVSDPTQEQREEFQRVSAEFGESVLGQILGCLVRFRRDLKESRDKRGNDPWGDNLRFFLTGGGGRSLFYKKRVADGPLEEELIPFTRWHRTKEQRENFGQGLRAEVLPVPADLRNFPVALHGDFDRNGRSRRRRRGEGEVCDPKRSRTWLRALFARRPLTRRQSV